jgi:hypothetical protein
MEEFNSKDIIEKQKIKKRFATMEVGLFEISFVLIIIIVLFGLLNYFNILSLSTLYPNQLGFLPHQIAGKQVSRVSESTPTPKPIPTFPGYNWNYAQITLEKFLEDNIKPEFLPPKIQGEQGLIQTDNKRGTGYEFGVKWNTNSNELIMGFFHYGIKTNTERDRDLLIEIQNGTDSKATESLTKNLAQKYLNNIPDNTIFNCKIFSDNKTTACESFSNISNGKKGFGLIISQQLDNGQPYNLTTVFACFFPKNGIYYNHTSCIDFK